MFAIVEIAGQQFPVEVGRKLYVNRLDKAEGETIEFEKVLLIGKDGGETKIDSLGNTFVKATVLRHLLGDKVMIFKKKRRKGYRLKKGHRQSLTQIQIEEIFV